MFSAKNVKMVVMFALGVGVVVVSIQLAVQANKDLKDGFECPAGECGPAGDELHDYVRLIHNLATASAWLSGVSFVIMGFKGSSPGFNNCVNGAILKVVVLVVVATSTVLSVILYGTTLPRALGYLADTADAPAAESSDAWTYTRSVKDLRDKAQLQFLLQAATLVLGHLFLPSRARHAAPPEYTSHQPEYAPHQPPDTHHRHQQQWAAQTPMTAAPVAMHCSTFR